MAVTNEAVALAKLDQAQAQAKASARQLFLSKKQCRVLEVNAADLAAENKTKFDEHRAEKIFFERRLASLEQELVTAKKDLESSTANRRVQGKMHKKSQRQQ